MMKSYSGKNNTNTTMIKTRASKFSIFVSLGFGAALALTLQTATRKTIGEESPIGIGELGLLFFAILAITSRLKTPINSEERATLRFSAYLTIWILFILTPITLIMFSSDIRGSSIRDLAAYVFLVPIIYSISLYHKNLKEISLAFITIFFISSSIQYLFGAENAWYDGVRFTAGAENPNQFALHLVAAEILIIIFARYKWTLLIFCLILGILSGSDAYLLSRAALVIAAASAYLLRRIPPLAAVPSALALAWIFLRLLKIDLLDMLEMSWSAADQGAGRIPLLLNGIIAWADSPISFVFGNGAGAFSGTWGPFEAKEAHNTTLDILTIGGFFGLVLCYAPLVRSLIFCRAKRYYLLMSGVFSVLIFIQFHYVGRQPVFWVLLFILWYYNTFYFKRVG